MAAVKKPRSKVWENRETMLLLQKWGDENIQTKLLSCTRKKPIWQEHGQKLRTMQRRMLGSTWQYGRHTL